MKKHLQTFFFSAFIPLILFASCDEHAGEGLNYNDNILMPIIITSEDNFGENIGIDAREGGSEDPAFNFKGGQFEAVAVRGSIEFCANSPSVLCILQNSSQGDTWFGTEIRIANGWNNWRDFHNNNQIKGQLVTRNELVHTEESEEFKADIFEVSGAYATSPPAYLHLSLRSLTDLSSDGTDDETMFFGSKSKAWRVNRIEKDGVDITNDLDWACYNDNEYVFSKTGKVKYSPGLSTCDVDQAIANEGLTNVWFNYAIEPEELNYEDPGKITLTFTSSAEVLGYSFDDFVIEIIESDFNSAVFRVTNGLGEQADLYMVPAA